MTFEGTLNEPGTIAIAGGSPVPTDGSNHFRLTAPVTSGSNLLPITAADAYGNTTSQHIQLTVSGIAAQTLTYDLNGNLVSDGTRTYEWDAVNRLTAVNSGTQRSEFTYNGLSQRVKIIEKTNGAVTSTKQLVWCPGEAQPCEERDASNNVTKRYYGQGVMIGSTKYFYTRDHLGSVRELTNGSGTVQTRYDYDPYGRRTRLTGTLDADFGFTGQYYHQSSALHLPLYRAYDADQGRWISRDPIAEKGGVNLYAYVNNNPINYVDPFGLCRMKGESFYDCLTRYARDYYGDALDWSDMLGIWSWGAAAAAGGTSLLSSGAEAAADSAIKDAPLAGVRAGGSMTQRMAAAAEAAQTAGRLSVGTAALGFLSKATAVVAAAATGFSAGARAAFIGDCM